MNTEPAYITIVEGPPPEFQPAPDTLSSHIIEGQAWKDVALVEMRTFDGPKLVKRCTDAWDEGRPARLDFPLGDGSRAESDIVAVRWKAVPEGHKLYLWVRLESDIALTQDE
jgi:hypothetical protein